MSTLNDLHRAYRDPLSVPCVLCHAPVGAACVDVPEYVTRLDANGIHPLRPSDAMRAARRAWLDVLELEDRLETIGAP